MPAGIEQGDICLESGKLAGPQCVDTRKEYFVAGSEPEKCDLHNVAAAVHSDDSLAVVSAAP